MKRVCLMILAATLTSSFGCGGIKVYPVTGKVEYRDGRPVPAGVVAFELVADKLKDRLTSSCPINSDGTFALTTILEGDGGVEGKHRVAILPPPDFGSEAEPDQRAKPALPKRYQSFDTSGLECEVTRAGPNRFTFVIDSE